MSATPKAPKKLSLNIQTLRQLKSEESAEVVGGAATDTCKCTETNCPTHCWICYSDPPDQCRTEEI